MAIVLPLETEVLNELRLELLKFLSDHSGLSVPAAVSFTKMDDGDMGSFEAVAVGHSLTTKARLISDFAYTDVDGMGVLVSAFSDGHVISAVDFWRYDFGPILSFPEAKDLEAR
ncbi:MULTISPECIES: hypothetical protein [Mesorhizobium]|uniref:DUF6984 domain-containing protein n=1 Tax=Mesorhizobium opportunistum (strain LMG 24607 / HAMBI 3007 / WSM2075) TaxID=536019 RepID=F7YDE7_MESOW|nr:MULTISPECIES: hypothetical protein [Mesorhizobium]AEH86743.1 hypothetical protein Mesop_2267 [Mesorhizobium opportunistum WSM2075]MCA0033176.1 hypothetical protein [Mesorhizobium sp. B263B2A]TPN46456.1 hypothetical protein FJ978_25355 [Mesorhizobium sp. B1-1-7]